MLNIKQPLCFFPLLHKSLLVRMISGFLYCLIIFTSIITDAKAQVINANLIITPPYSVYFRDYSGYGKNNNILLSVTSTTTRRVYLAGSVTKDDNTIVISAKNGYRPLVPILLTANTPAMLNGLQLRNIFGDGTTGDLNLTGLTANDIGLNQALPEGNYSFCIQIKDYDTREVISMPCKTIFVTYKDPPKIIKPFPNSAEHFSNPQKVDVTWENTAPAGFGVNYRLKMVKLIKGLTPLDALNNNVQLILDKGNLITPYYPLDVSSGIKLEPGQTYAVQVIAQSPTAYFKNGGKSEVTVFVYGTTQELANSQLKNIPIKYPTPYNAGKYDINNKNPLYIRWESINNLENIATLADIMGVNYNAQMARPSANTLKYEIQITDKATKKLVDKMESFDMLFYQEQLNTNKFLNNKDYEYEIKAYAYNKNDELPNGEMAFGNTAKFLPYTTLVGKSFTGSFTYKKIADPIADIKYVTLKGKVLYEFDKDPTVGAPSDGGHPITGEIRLTKFFKQVDAAGNIINTRNISADKINPKEPSQYIVNTASDGSFVAKVQQTPVRLTKGYIECYSIDYPKNNYYAEPDREIEIKKTIINGKIYEGESPDNINVGEFTSKVHAYKLNLHLSKGYKQGSSLRVTQALSGLKVTIYRDPKVTGVPVYEGSGKASKGFIYKKTGTGGKADIISRDTTRISNTPGKAPESVVSFNKLLCALDDQDLYWINVYNDKTGEVVLDQPFNFIGGTGTPGKVTYADSHKKITDYLYEVEKTANWTTAKAPVASIKGRILYKYADGVGGARPLVNASITLKPFLVLTEIDGGKSYTLPADFNQSYLRGSNGNQGGSEYAFLSYLKSVQQNSETTTNGDGSFEFKDIALWDSVTLAKDLYTFSIPFPIAPPDKNESPAQTSYRDFQRATLLGDKDGAAAAAAAFRKKVMKEFTQYDRDPFNPHENLKNKVKNREKLNKGLGVEGLKEGLNNLDVESNVENTGYNKEGFNNMGNLAEELGINGATDFKSQPNSGGESGKYDASNVTSTKVGQKVTEKVTEKIQKNTNFTRGPFGNFNDIDYLDNNYDKPKEEYGSDGPCKAKLVYRIIIANKDVYCSPDNDIEINPLQSLDAGLLYSVVKTIKVNAQLIGKDNNKPVTNIPIEIKRTEIIPGLQGEGEAFNNVAFKEKPDPDPLMVDYGSSKIEGVTFNHLLRSKQYSIKPNIQQEANTTTSYVPQEGTFNYIASDIDLLPEEIRKDFLFNSEFEEKTESIPMVLEADLPVIAGRLINSISQKGIQEGGKVILWLRGPLGVKYPVSLPIDAEGYFSFKVKEIEGQSITVDASVDGYTTAGGATSYSYPIAAQQKGQKLFKALYFTQSATITGYVVNEKGEHLPSLYKEQNVDFVQETDMDMWCAYGQSIKKKGSGVATGAYTFNTNFTGNTTSDCQQNFTTYATPGKEAVIIIIPNDLKYFNDTIKFFPIKGPNVKGKITLITREHRINFKVVGPNGEAIPGAKVLLLDKELTMNDKGVRSYNFMNISEKNYWVKIIPPPGSNYIGRQTSFESIETKNFVEQKFVLDAGKSISGIVKLNGAPLKNAKVYINNGEGAAITQTITGNDGKYTLSGIKKPRYNKITITASGPARNDGTILAESKPVTLDDGNEVKFDLQLLKGVNANKLLGYDVSIEKSEPLDRGQYKISGTLDLNSSGGDFKLYDADTRISFTDVIINTDNRDANGLVLAAPVADIPLDVYAFKARFGAAYNSLLTASESKIIIKKLSTITGAVEAKAKIIDNSFNFPSPYLEFDNTKFYFAIKQNNAITNLLSLFSTVENKQKPTYYFTDDTSGAISFKLAKFDAVSPVDQTYFTEGKIRLLPTITATGINTLGKQLQVDLPELKIDQNGVGSLDGNKPIEFRLEDWTISIPKWKFSTDEGGIVADKYGGNVIKTKVLDIPFKKFRLRNDVLLIDETNLKSLKVGGIVDVKLAPDAVATFGLDQKTGNDLKQHYILRMLGNNGAPVGNLQLPEDGFKQPIEIQAATLVSSGEQYIDFSPNSKNVTAFGLVDFKPSMIESSPGSFSILGNVDLGIPRLASFTGGFTYSGTPTSITVEPNFKAINFDIGKGYVQFKSGASAEKIIKNGSIELYGTVMEPKQLPENLNISAKLTRTASNTQIDIIKDPKLDYGDGTTMVLSKGQTTVIGNDWDYLTFTGTLKKDGKRPEGFKDDNPLKFKVFGEINYESGTLAVTNMETPLGNMNMEFDWPGKSIKGSLTFDDISIGAVSASGVAEIKIDKNGFYTFIAADVVIPVPIISPFKAGFLLGKYDKLPPDVIARTMQFNHNKLNTCEPIKLLGFLVAGRKDLFEPINEHIDLPPLVPLVSVGLVAECGVDASLFMNFSDGNPDMTLQVGAFGNVNISLASITGTSATGSVAVDLTGKIKYKLGGDFNADFCNGISLKYNVIQKIPLFPDIERSGSISLSAKGGLKNKDPYFKLSLTDCSGPPCQVIKK